MQWSKLKSQVESFVCDSLKGRVELFTTWYKNSGSPQRARGAILIDKKEIIEFNTDKWIVMVEELNQEELWSQGVFNDLEFREGLKEYLSLSIDQALASRNILIKTLALIDRRVGKRKLHKMQMPKDEHELVKFIYNLRCRAEGMDL